MTPLTGALKVYPMNDTREDQAQQIAEIEALLNQQMPDVARRSLEATLQALRAAALPSADTTRGTVDVPGTLRGNAVGVNYGTVQAFFGTQPPADAKELLDNYLESLIADHAYLRLGK